MLAMGLSRLIRVLSRQDQSAMVSNNSMDDFAIVVLEQPSSRDTIVWDAKTRPR